MRILLDECLPRRLAKFIEGHAIQTVPQAGWAGLTNGRLLSLMPGRFDVFLTADRNLVFQQKVENFKVGVVVLHAESNRFEDLLPLVPEISKALQEVQPGQIVHVGA